MSAWESLHDAILELVQSAPIKQRLIYAYRRHLASLAVDQLPGEARESFQLVLAALEGVAPMRGEDAVTASVRKMSNQEADECSARIVDIYGVTCRALLHASRASAEVVKLHTMDREASDYDESTLIVNR